MQKWGREYDQFGVILKQTTVNVLNELNTGLGAYQSVLYDKKFVKTIMEETFAGEEITAQTELDPRKLDFIRSKQKKFIYLYERIIENCFFIVFFQRFLTVV